MAEFVIRGAGTVIHKYRTERKWTLEFLAIRAGLEKSQIAKYESNKVGISDAKLDLLAHALEVPTEKLAYECLMTIRPELKNKSIGKLLGSLVGTPPSDVAPVPGEKSPVKKRLKKVK